MLNFPLQWIARTESLLTPPLCRGMTGRAVKNPIKRTKQANIFRIIGKSWSWAVQGSTRAHQIVSFKEIFDYASNFKMKTFKLYVFGFCLARIHHYYVLFLLIVMFTKRISPHSKCKYRTLKVQTLICSYLYV